MAGETITDRAREASLTLISSVSRFRILREWFAREAGPPREWSVVVGGMCIVAVSTPRDHRLTANGARDFCQRVEQDLVLAPFHTHQLRHALGTRATGNMGDARLTADTLGHRGLGSVTGYTKVSDQGPRVASAELEARRAVVAGGIAAFSRIRGRVSFSQYSPLQRALPAAVRNSVPAVRRDNWCDRLQSTVTHRSQV